MKTLSIHITGDLWGESTGHQLCRALMFSLLFTDQAAKETEELPVISDNMLMCISCMWSILKWFTRKRRC